MRLSESEMHSLAAHLEWEDWGKKFGFRLKGSNDEHAAEFVLPDGDRFYVPRLARELIDAAQ
jgi:hypothetical protein